MAINLEDIKRKITAIIAKAQGTDNEHEAAMFMAKAEKMLEEYQIEIWQLGDTGDPMGEDVMLKFRGATPSLNDHNLLSALAKFYGCKIVRYKRRVVNSKGRLVPETSYHVVGRESSRITTGIMMPFVMKQCLEAGARLERQYPGTRAQHTLRVVNALTLRIYKLIEDAKARVDENTEIVASRALVVVAELDAFIASKHGELKPGRKSTINISHAARDEAGKISLHRQATHGAGQLKLGHG